MKLGLVTYNMAAEWDVDTIIANCKATGFQGVELRTTHKHGVEDGLSAQQRRDLRKKLQDSGITFYGLGTAFEYHSPDKAVLQKNIDGSRSYIDLAVDLGMEGVKVRPNALPKDVEESKTLEQIGKAFHDVAAYGAERKIKIWMEVHGHDTCRVDRMRKISDLANHPNALLTYNCNPGETNEQGSCKPSFELLKHKIGCVHIQEIWDPKRYPWAEVLGLLKRHGYTGWTSYEGPGSTDPIRVMQCYKRIWDLLVNA